MFEILLFLFSVWLLNKSYKPIEEKLTVVTEKFATLEEHKKYYVIKNLLKATYLCFLCIVTVTLFTPYLYYNTWPNTLLRSLASMYVSNDVVGLYKVTGLKTSTRLHHMTTLLFLIVSWTLDFQQSKMAKLLFLYTFASALTFPVNAFLGLRHCYDEKELKDVCKIAYYTYGVVCVLNWILQCVFFENNLWSYYALILFVVYDDIVLLRWLREKNNLLNA
ncbi:MAG: hypothetical protein CMO44_17990 [Verrucomicrobiales bacterium]|nr:hypothetical protein [Verrucomicrobiales bacterium]